MKFKVGDRGQGQVNWRGVITRFTDDGYWISWVRADNSRKEEGGWSDRQLQDIETAVVLPFVDHNLDEGLFTI